MKLTKTILSRIMWMARGTATMLGLAVMLAVVLGVGTTALAAVPGDPFRLGQLNDVGSAGTGLTSDRSGPTLDLINTNAGIATEKVGDVIAPALGLTVQPGQPPLTVNPESGKATNLDADELDGKDSASFANGTGGKAQDANLLDGQDSSAFASGTNDVANNADKLDGQDSTAFVSSSFGTAPNANNLDGQDSTRFFSGKTYTVENSRLGPGDSGITSRIASCDPGDNALGGGGGSFADEPMLDSFPLGSRSWVVTMRDDFGPSEIRAAVLCADFPPLR